MIRYKCTVAYDGAGYIGWQSQRKDNSVQEKIETVLEKITHEKVNILAAGRTDAGVNAKGQVFHFDTKLDMSEYKWKGALNGLLPKDIHIVSVEKKDKLFHARYCVRSKQYDYKINLGEYDVMTRDYIYQCPYALDIEKMKRASRWLIGTHDFSSFCSNSYAETPDQVRTLDRIEFKMHGNVLTMSFFGRGFLRYMVRMLSAQLMDVGRGKITEEKIKDMIKHPSKTVSRRNAPPQGLTLVHVDYFDLLAENANGMVREFLVDDPLPEQWNLEQLEKAIRENEDDRIYALTTRNTQELLGMFELKRESDVMKARFLLNENPKSKETALSLEEEIKDTLSKRNEFIESITYGKESSHKPEDA